MTRFYNIVVDAFFLTLVLLSGFLNAQSSSVNISPQPAFFGKIPLGSTSDRIVSIVNLTTSNINVTNMSIIGNASSKFTVNNHSSSFTLYPVSPDSIKITYTPTTTGMDVAILQFQTSAGTFTDSLIGYGSLEIDNIPTFERAFGTSEDTYGNSIKQTPDGSYIIVGQTTKPDEIYPDVYIVKTDRFGKLLWSKIYGGNQSDGASDVLVLNDGSFLIVGTSDSYGSGTNDVFLMKLNPDGNILWSKAFSTNDAERASRIIVAQDNGYILCGSTTPNAPGSTSDALVMKIDQDGNMIWKKVYGGNGGQSAEDVLPTSDGGYIVDGSTADPNTGKLDVYLFKIDGSGNLIWEKFLGGSESDQAGSIVQTLDGGYILGGYTASYGEGARDAYMLKVDADGNEQWHKTFGTVHSDGFSSIIQTSDGSYVGVGHLNTYFEENTQFIYDDLLVIKTDNSGNLIWQKTFGREKFEDFASKIIINNAGGYVILGTTASYNPKNEIYLIELNSDGNITEVDFEKPKDEIPAEFNLSQNYPNPFNPITTIKYSIGAFTTSLSHGEKVSGGQVRVKLKVYDLLGREVATLVNEEKMPGNYQVKFDGANLASGVYFYSLSVSDVSLSSASGSKFVATKKMVLLK